MGLDLKAGERVWINMVDTGPPDIRRATATGNAYTDIDFTRHCEAMMVQVWIDGADKPGYWLERRLTRMSPLEVMSEI